MTVPAQASNPSYVPGGGDRLIERRRLTWSSRAKVGSLERAGHRPGGGQVGPLYSFAEPHFQGEDRKSEVGLEGGG